MTLVNCYSALFVVSGWLVVLVMSVLIWLLLFLLLLLCLLFWLLLWLLQHPRNFADYKKHLGTIFDLTEILLISERNITLLVPVM